MPFQLSYTDDSNVTHPDSFWVIAVLSLNHLNSSLILQFNGYHTVEDFNGGFLPIAFKSFAINDSNIYNSYVKYQFEAIDPNVNDIFSFYVLLEIAILNVTDFFLGAAQISIVAPVSLEVGAESETRVNVIFSEEITGNDAGVTIKADGVPATISAWSKSGTDPRNYRFDLAAAVDPDAVVTFDYDGASNLNDRSLLPLRAFAALPVVNNVGAGLLFNLAGNSGHIPARIF